MARKILIFAAAAFLCSCGKYDIAGLFVASGPDVNKRFAQSMEYDIKHPMPDVSSTSNEYKMYVVTDIHSTGACPNLVNFVSACLADPSVEHSVLCLGDLVSLKDSFDPVVRDIAPLYDAGWNFFTTPGNHDLNYGLWPRYAEHWPRGTYKFKVQTPSDGADFFICIDSGDGKIGTEQRKWLETVLASAQDEGIRNIYVFTHTHFFKKDASQGHTSNLPVAETMDLMSLFSRYGVKCVLTGHDHHYERTVFRDVEYYTLNALCNTPGSYYLATFGDKLTLSEVKAE